VTEEATGQAHRRTVQMLADPELGGDLLLVGLALAGLLDLDAPRAGERVRLGDVAKLAWPRTPGTRYILRRVLAGDARTYRAPEPSFGEDCCTAPMLRRPANVRPREKLLRLRHRLGNGRAELDRGVHPPQ
jgi:hypothetical protein